MWSHQRNRQHWLSIGNATVSPSAICLQANKNIKRKKISSDTYEHVGASEWKQELNQPTMFFLSSPHLLREFSKPWHYAISELVWLLLTRGRGMLEKWVFNNFRKLAALFLPTKLVRNSGRFRTYSQEKVCISSYLLTLLMLIVYIQWYRLGEPLTRLQSRWVGTRGPVRSSPGHHRQPTVVGWRWPGPLAGCPAPLPLLTGQTTGGHHPDRETNTHTGTHTLRQMSEKLKK